MGRSGKKKEERRKKTTERRRRKRGESQAGTTGPGGGGSGGRRLLAGRIHIDQHLNSGRISPQLRNLQPAPANPQPTQRTTATATRLRCQISERVQARDAQSECDERDRWKEKRTRAAGSQLTISCETVVQPHAMHACLDCYPYARYALISSSQTPPNSSVPSYLAVVLCLASKQHRVVPNHALAELVRPAPGVTLPQFPVSEPSAGQRDADARGDETGGWQVVGGFGGLRAQLASVPVAGLRALSTDRGPRSIRVRRVWSEPHHSTVARLPSADRKAVE